MKPNQTNNQKPIFDITIHDVYQSGDINCLRKFLNTIECTKKSSLISTTINRRDLLGRSILHKLASANSESDSIHWLELLAQNHLLQLNIPDLESGWTPLHRALYHGNLRFARILIDQLECDTNIKDHEGLSAFDLYHSTIDGPIFNSISTKPLLPSHRHTDLFTWGSNRNFVLGIHDDSNRHHPERIHLKRSNCSQTATAHPIDPVNPFISNPVSFVAIGRLHTALITSEGELRVCGFGSGGRLGLTACSRSNGQDKPTGGISAETQFTFAPVKGGGLARQVKFVALGQDHTVVITNAGQVFTFGMNRFGQLGYGPDSAGASIENMIQVEPKRVLGLLKKVDIIGAAASRWHTAVFSSDSLFTWGANRGQLGYHNPHPHNSLASIQITPRKVAIAHTSIIQLSCTSYETVYLCENSSDVYLLKSEVTIRVVFPFDRFPPEIQVSGMPSNQGHTTPTRILQLDSSDQTLAAVSSMGDVYIVDLENPNPLENPINYATMSSSPYRSNASMVPSGPTFKPRRIWCSTKWTNAAQHVAVGLDGDVIITTMSGHVYTSYRRSGVSGAHKALDNRSTHPTTSSVKKSYKFQRVQYLQRVSHVAANPTGAYAAIRMDVELKEIQQRSPEEKITLPSMLASILPHLKKYASSVPEVHMVPSGSLPSRKCSDPTCSGNSSPHSQVHLDTNEDAIEEEEEEEREDMEWDCRVGSALFGLSVNWNDHQPDPTLESGDIFLVANSGEKILVHRFILCSRSLILDQILNQLISVNGISYHPDTFPSIWDNRVWPRIENAHQEFLSNTRLSGKPKPAMPHLVNEAKEGLKNLATNVGFPALELSLARLGKATPKPLLSHHLRVILPTLGLPTSHSPEYNNNVAAPEHHLVPNSRSSNLRPDMELELKDGEIINCHSILMRAQCPFFRLMYDQEVWVTSRRQSKAAGNSKLIRIDMGHLTKNVLQVVLRHIYTDDADDLFLTKANELMMDKLKYICSVVLRSCVNLSTVTAIATEADFYRADSLKETCMNYMIYNLDAIFEDKGLIKIPDELLLAIATYLKRVQTDKFPISRSTRIMEELMDYHSQFLLELDLPKPKLALTVRHWKSLQKSLTHQSSQALADADTFFDKKFPRGSVELGPCSLTRDSNAPGPCPIISGTPPKALDSANERISDEAPFVMEEVDGAVNLTRKGLGKTRPSTSNDSPAWATPIKKVTPIDLRTVMSMEKQRGPIEPSQPPIDTLSFSNSSPRLPYDLAPSQKLSQREKRRQSAEASKSRPELTSAGAATYNIQSKGPAWRSISSGGDRKIPGPSGQALSSSLTSSASYSGFPSSSQATSGPPRNAQTTAALSGRVLGIVAKNPETNDPASAVGATVITPVRAVNGIAASNASRRTLAGQDTPWTNYASTSTHFVPTGLSSSPFDSSPNPGVDPYYESTLEGTTPNIALGSRGIDIAPHCDQATTAATRNMSHAKPTNFSIIQELQAKESWALYGAGKQKPKLAEIQEEENRRLLEKKQEEQFLKWFEEESLRLQQQPTLQPRSKKSPHSSRSSKPASSQSVVANSGENSTGRSHKDKKGPRQSHMVNADTQNHQEAKNADSSSPPASHHLLNIPPKSKKKSKPNKSLLSNNKPTSSSTGTSTPTPTSTSAAKGSTLPTPSSVRSTKPAYSTQRQDSLPSLHHQNSSRVKAN
ncbi:hypothetical protein VP01_388g12 [Puccinia sorghi]|uniref:BTB domain-containing protein n=1 Tax=Puccinia sorghi TaxID=27349 RepID=A0A0L6USX8_9BASI|nr:hypothetical protein VP01_388g12 [Puccinia sorghi]